MLDQKNTTNVKMLDSKSIRQRIKESKTLKKITTSKTFLKIKLLKPINEKETNIYKTLTKFSIIFLIVGFILSLLISILLFDNYGKKVKHYDNTQLYKEYKITTECSFNNFSSSTDSGKASQGVTESYYNYREYSSSYQHSIWENKKTFGTLAGDQSVVNSINFIEKLNIYFSLRNNIYATNGTISTEEFYFYGKDNSLNFIKHEISLDGGDKLAINYCKVMFSFLPAADSSKNDAVHADFSFFNLYNSVYTPKSEFDYTLTGTTASNQD